MELSDGGTKTLRLQLTRNPAVRWSDLLDGESKTMNEYEPIAMAFWTKEADKIIAAYPEKHREYHGTVLKGTWERGWIEALQWAASQIVPDGNPEVALEKIEREIKRMVEPSNDLAQRPERE